MGSGGLADALFGRTKQRVLGLLFGQPDREFAQKELIQLAGVGSGAVQRELERLVVTELVSGSSSTRGRLYRANRSSPIFEELRGIIEKTVGVPGVVRTALAPIASRIEIAFLYGAVAKQTDRASSDIDLLVVSDDLASADVYRALEAAEKSLGRSIHPTLYTSAEFRSRQSKSSFLAKVMSGPRTMLVGIES